MSEIEQDVRVPRLEPGAQEARAILDRGHREIDHATEMQEAVQDALVAGDFVEYYSDRPSGQFFAEVGLNNIRVGFLAFGLACDLLSRPPKVRRGGTADGSAESLQRVFHLGREQA